MGGGRVEGKLTLLGNPGSRVLVLTAARLAEWARYPLAAHLTKILHLMLILCRFHADIYKQCGLSSLGPN